MDTVPTQTEIERVYHGSDGDATKALYARLDTFGAIGKVALNLFRACKCSERAKGYRRSSHRGAAYDRKNWSMGLLCEILTAEASGLGIKWGWGVDLKAVNFENVLYVEIPTGQVSFHCGVRGEGPDYGSPWDGRTGQAPDRICRWVTGILTATTPAPREMVAPADGSRSDVGFPAGGGQLSFLEVIDAAIPQDR